MLPPPRVLGPWLSEAAPDIVMEIVSALPGSPLSVTCTLKSTGPELLVPEPERKLVQPALNVLTDVLWTANPLSWLM